MKHVARFFLGGLALVVGLAVQAESKPQMATLSDRAQEMLEDKRGSFSKLGTHLRQLHRQNLSNLKGADLGDSVDPGLRAYNPQSGNTVTVDIAIDGDPNQMLETLEGIGLENGAVYGRIVSGILPASSLDSLASMDGVRFARQAIAVNSAGTVTSRGVNALFADIATSAFGITGSGVRVGVLSDSYDQRPGAITTAAQDILANDLPSDIIVLEDAPGPASDEGRAMMQLIHDVAPGTSQAFHTALGGQANFAQGIVELNEVAGSSVIVDDIMYVFEPMFQDGIIAQAVDTVRDNGAAYFSSAGNNGRDAWETSLKGFKDSGVVGLFGGARHDFDETTRGVDDLQSFVLGPGASVTFILQWADPYFSVSGAPGAFSDVDILLYLADGTFTGLGSAGFNTGADPIEGFGVINLGPAPLELALGIELFSGPPPLFMKWVAFANGPFQVLDFPTDSGSLYGHTNADGAVAVGATAWFNTPLFNPNVSLPVLNSFSSAGPTGVLFDGNGGVIADLRRRPDVVGPDGGNTTFFGGDLPFPVPGTTEPDGFPNFFGTSASAPHVAGVAAMMLEVEPNLDPERVRHILKDTAQDMDDPSTAKFDQGYDFATGSGFVQADLAVVAASLRNHQAQVCLDGKTVQINPLDVFDALAGGATLGRCK